MNRWLGNRREAAIDAVVSYAAPRLFLVLVIAAVAWMAIFPPFYTAAVVGLVSVIARWTQEKKGPAFSNEALNVSNDSLKGTERLRIGGWTRSRWRSRAQAWAPEAA
jgi:hypothetical protein